MRTRSRRRSVSSWVSPGPRRPIPPFCRSRWVQPRTSRVLMCSSCASSTCNLPSWVRARWAKMSRISPVRSSTRHSNARSRLRSWLGVKVWLKITSSTFSALTRSCNSSTLPLPIRYLALGWWRETLTNATVSAPAERTSSWNSCGSSRASGFCPSRCTRTACSPPPGRSKNKADSRQALPGSAGWSPLGRRTGRLGTTVEIACL